MPSLVELIVMDEFGIGPFYPTLDELEHRFNNRDNKFLFRDALLKLVNAAAFPYTKLTQAA